MGAAVFENVVSAKNAKEAFYNAVEDACYEYGRNGYTGTIAEKENFVMIKCPEGEDPFEYSYHLIEKEDPRIDDKWGPAGCIELPGNDTEQKRFLFFGWASE